MTTLKHTYDTLVSRDDTQGRQYDFKTMRADVRLAVYEKLLFKSGEGDARATAVLKDISTVIAQLPADKKPGDTQENFKNALQRYQTAKANAVYQDFLSTTVLARAKDIPTAQLMFDPQGRLIHELKLSDEDRKTVLKAIENSLGINGPEGRDPQAAKDALKKLLGGRTPTDTTLCSVDLSNPTRVGQPPSENEQNRVTLQKKFEETYPPVRNPKITDRIVSITIPDDKRNSIIASFEENYAHLSLMAKSYENLSRKAGFDKEPGLISADQWQTIRQTAAKTLQKAVAKVFKEALEKATSADGTVDIIKLNEAMAKERKLLANTAKTALLTEVVEHLKPKENQSADVQRANRANLVQYMQNLYKHVNKHTFTEMTATGHDYFHTSNYLQQGMLISGTKDTAHNKPKFKEANDDQAAYRRVTYTYRDDQGNLQATSAVSARAPSPALVMDKAVGRGQIGFAKTDVQNEIRADLVKKYGFLHEQMRTMRGEKPGPVVENLFTSFHSTAFEGTVDWGNNRQKTSALRMVEAMHEFNANQRITDPTRPRSENNFLYVQNIGTNRHTYDLGYRGERGSGVLSGSVELDDITLSAEMALLHTLKENSVYLSDELKQKIDSINNEVLYDYCQYLSIDAKDRPAYFADSKYGARLIREIGKFKKELPALLNKPENNDNAQDLNALTSNALLKMVSTNQHWDMRYGQLAQVLSMYNQWASTGGCKSGNERNQDVMLRFALLKSIHERVGHTGDLSQLKDHEKAIFKELQAYTKGETSSPDGLRAAIAVSVRECNLHGGAAAISREDQGGAAKVDSRSRVHDIINDIKITPIRWLAKLVTAALGATAFIVGSLTYPIRPLSKALFKVSDSLLSSFNTNNGADREMQLSATGASATQAHKGQDKLTEKTVLKVLEDHSLFKDNPLTAQEKDGFKKDKKAHGADAANAPVIGDGQAPRAKLADASALAGVSENRRASELSEPLLGKRTSSLTTVHALLAASSHAAGITPCSDNAHDAPDDIPPPPPPEHDGVAATAVAAKADDPAEDAGRSMHL